MVAKVCMSVLPHPSFEKIYSLGQVPQKVTLLGGLLFPYRSTIFLVCVFLFLMSRRAQTLAAHCRILCPSRPLYLESTACTTFFFHNIVRESKGMGHVRCKENAIFSSTRRKNPTCICRAWVSTLWEIKWMICNP